MESMVGTVKEKLVYINVVVMLRQITLFVVFVAAFWWLPVAVFWGSTTHPALRVAQALVGAIALVAIFDRDLYLPFLSETVLPAPLIASSTHAPSIHPKPEDVIIKLPTGLPPNTKVVYWAAENGDPRMPTKTTWKQAYGGFTNSGVVETDTAGVANIMLQCPQQYAVGPFKKVLSRHLHYRYADPKRPGMLSRVITHKFECNTPKTATST